MAHTELPKLSKTSHHHSDCCLSLSTTLIDDITSVLLRNGVRGAVLSVGSGKGLLERLLSDHWRTHPDYSLRIHGVEVKASEPVNKYLAANECAEVIGTWAVSDYVDDAAVLLFVYPRDPGLLSKYLEPMDDAECGPSLVIWLGPVADLPVYADCFKQSKFFCDCEVVQTEGLPPYESMMISRRKMP